MAIQRRRPHRRPQAIRRRAIGRAARYGILDGVVLVVLAVGLFYLARPAGASELPAPVVSTSGQASAGPPTMVETGLPWAGSERALGEPMRDAVATPAIAQPAAAAAKPRQPTLYDLAAARYGLDARLLRALHLVESSGAADGCLANLEGSGALGPLQFQPVTFRAYGVDADGDGRADICGFADSLFSAARYLQALGADADLGSAATRRALARYGTHPGLVLLLAR